MNNGPPRGFSNSEFEQGTRRAQTCMPEQGQDAMFFTTEHNVRCFSGFDTPFWHSPTRL